MLIGFVPAAEVVNVQHAPACRQSELNSRYFWEFQKLAKRLLRVLCEAPTQDHYRPPVQGPSVVSAIAGYPKPPSAFCSSRLVILLVELPQE